MIWTSHNLIEHNKNVMSAWIGENLVITFSFIQMIKEKNLVDYNLMSLTKTKPNP